MGFYIGKQAITHFIDYSRKMSLWKAGNEKGRKMGTKQIFLWDLGGWKQLFFFKEFLKVIKKAVNSAAPHTGKTGKHSTAQTRNYLYLLLTIFLLRQLFSCPCFPKLLQTWHTAKAVLPSKSGVLGCGTSALGKVAMQTESPTSLRGGKPFLEVSIAAFHPVLPHRHRWPPCSWWMRRHLFYFGVLSGKKNPWSF